MQFVAGPNRTWPAQIVETDAENAASRLEFAVDHQPHRHRSGVPAARRQALKRRFARRFFVGMERLRIELPRKRKDLLLVDAMLAGFENLSGGKVFQIVNGHLFMPCGGCAVLNHAPLATATALIRPNAASATASAMKTSVSSPVHRKAKKPPTAAIISRAMLARNGHSKRPAPCEAK